MLPSEDQMTDNSDDEEAFLGSPPNETLGRSQMTNHNARLGRYKEGVYTFGFLLLVIGSFVSILHMEVPISALCTQTTIPIPYGWCAKDYTPSGKLCGFDKSALTNPTVREFLTIIAHGCLLLCIWGPATLALREGFGRLPQGEAEFSRVVRNWPLIVSGFGCCSVAFYVGYYFMEMALERIVSQGSTPSIFEAVFGALGMWSWAYLEIQCLGLALFASGRPPRGSPLRLVQYMLLYRACWWMLFILLDSSIFTHMIMCVDSSVAIFVATLFFPCPIVFHLLCWFQFRQWKENGAMPQYGRHILHLPYGLVKRAEYGKLIMLAVIFNGLEWVSSTKMRDWQVPQMIEAGILFLGMLGCIFFVLSTSNLELHKGRGTLILWASTLIHAGVQALRAYFDCQAYLLDNKYASAVAAGAQFIAIGFTLTQSLLLTFRKDGALPGSEIFIKILFVLNAVWIFFATYSYGLDLDYITSRNVLEVDLLHRVYLAFHWGVLLNSAVCIYIVADDIWMLYATNETFATLVADTRISGLTHSNLQGTSSMMFSSALA